jgi:hypothetical protein
MQPRFWLVGIGLAALLGAPAPTGAGGGGPLELTRISGVVEIKLLADGGEYWHQRAGSDRRVIESLRPVGRWQRAKTGYIVGTFLLRTGPRSWVHLDDRLWCVDANTLVRIESYADYGIQVLRGQVSRADGRRGKPVFKKFATDDPRGILALP